MQALVGIQLEVGNKTLLLYLLTYLEDGEIMSKKRFSFDVDNKTLFILFLLAVIGGMIAGLQG